MKRVCVFSKAVAVFSVVFHLLPALSVLVFLLCIFHKQFFFCRTMYLLLYLEQIIKLNDLFWLLNFYCTLSIIPTDVFIKRDVVK